MREAGEKKDEDNQFEKQGQHAEINYTSHCYTGMSLAMVGTTMQRSAHMYLLSTVASGDGDGLRIKQQQTLKA